MQWIVLLALSIASSERMNRTSLAFVTPLPSHRSHSRWTSSVADFHYLSLFSSSSNHQSSDNYYLTPGKPSSYFIVEKYHVPCDGFTDSSLSLLFDEADVRRLDMTTTNVTLPSALSILDSDRYPDMKSAIMAARSGSILIQRHRHTRKQRYRGGSGDRIYPNDILYRQEQLDIGASEYWHNCYNASGSQPQLVLREGNGESPLPVVYEDDHIAIINKPGGLDLFEHDSHHATISSSGEKDKCNSVKGLLPFVLKPPADGTRNVLPIPEPAHRLDKLTSGLLLVAKTRPALSNLSAQFRNCTIEKTYTAICYNVPEIIPNDYQNIIGNEWQRIDEPLDGKLAITFWRVLERFEYGGMELSWIEMKPKTGRYRQLRRHMAKFKGCPLVGDTVFARGIERRGDEGGGVPVAKELGLFLCSTAVQFEHPYLKGPGEHKSGWDEVAFLPEGGILVMNARTELPKKFASIIE